MRYVSRTGTGTVHPMVKFLTHLGLAAAAILAAFVCLIWLGIGYTTAIIAYAADAQVIAVVALAIGSAPSAAALTLGWLFFRKSRRTL